MDAPDNDPFGLGDLQHEHEHHEGRRGQYGQHGQHRQSSQVADKRATDDGELAELREEKQAMAEQIAELEKKLDKKDKNGRGRRGMQGWRDNLRHISYVPNDQFAHQYSLINPLPMDVQEFNQLLNQHVLLGAIDHNQLMRYYQDDMVYLTNFFDMAKQEGKIGEAIKSVFDTLYWGWVGEIRMTSVKGGKERDYQSFAQFREKGVQPYQEGGDEGGFSLRDLLGGGGGSSRRPPRQRGRGGGDSPYV